MTKEQVQLAIVACAGYTDVEKFRETCETIPDLIDDFFGGLLSAVNAIEKIADAPVKPTVYRLTPKGGKPTVHAQCGRCGNLIRFDGRKYLRDNYCRKCGTEILWGGDKDGENETMPVLRT